MNGKAHTHYRESVLIDRELTNKNKKEWRTTNLAGKINVDTIGTVKISRIFGFENSVGVLKKRSKSGCRQKYTKSFKTWPSHICSCSVT